MKTGAAGIRIVKQWESCRLEAYQDGSGVWTIGWGHTKGVRRGMVITQAKAEVFLKADLRDAENGVNSAVLVPLSQGQFDALVSFTYNLGVGAFKKSTLLKVLNKGNYAAVPGQLLRYNKDNGRVVKGLTRRREAEAALWEKSSFAKSPAPVMKSRTAQAGAAVVVGGGISIADAAPDFIDKVQQAQWSFDGTTIGLIIGIAVIALGAFILWNRIKDGKAGQSSG